jgi:hypothetical protein
MYETRSWHTYRYHLVVFGKSGVTEGIHDLWGTQPFRAQPVEGFITSSHLAEVELHLAQRLCEDDV